MKIYIAAEIEGMSSVVSNDACFKGRLLYSYGRKQMTREVNAAIEGAIEAGATEIVVNDAHANSLSLIPELLHEEAKLILGSVKPNNQMAGIDESFDAAMLIGFHAKSNSAGVMGHSLTGHVVNNMWINDQLIGETTYNAAIAGAYNVPVILVTGDNIVCEEAKTDLGNSVKTVAVKTAISSFSANSLHPNKAVKLIKEAAKQAVLNLKNCKPYNLNAPYVAKMQFHRSDQAQGALRYPDAQKLNENTIIVKSNTMLESLNALFGLMKYGC